MAVQTIYICDPHKGKCPEDAGEVRRRRFPFTGRWHKIDACQQWYDETQARIDMAYVEVVKIAEEVGQIEPIDTRDFLPLAAKHWINFGKNVEKYGGYTKGTFAKEKMETFRSKFSEWESWKVGDLIPEGWQYDEDEDLVIYVGEGKLDQ